MAIYGKKMKHLDLNANLNCYFWKRTKKNNQLTA